MKRTKVKERKKTVRRAKVRNTTLLPLLSVLFFLLVAVFGLFSNWPHPDSITNSAPPLPKLLALRTTPSPSPKLDRTSRRFIAKALAQESEQSDYCITLPILFYHHVQPIEEATRLGHAQFTVDSTIFDQQMQYLKDNGYITLSIDNVVDMLINKTEVSRKSVAITFDDGYVDMYSYAYPILKQYGFVGNFAIPTGLLEKSDYMTWDQLTEIARDPAMHIYNHTYSHSDLINNTPQAEKEIVDAQNDIQMRLGLRSNIFFYPYGTFNDAIVALLKAHGYIAAFSTLPGALQCESSIMSLHRIRIGNAPLTTYGL